MAKNRYVVPSVSAEVQVDLDEFDDDDIKEYLEHQGYTVISSAANASESASALDDCDEKDGFICYTHAINNIVKVCRKYDYNRTFYLELIASLLNMPSYTDRDILIHELMERLKDL